MSATTMTPETARQLIDEDRQTRVNSAAAAIQEILKAQNCDLFAQPQIAPDGRVIAQVQIVAR